MKNDEKLHIFHLLLIVSSNTRSLYLNIDLKDHLSVDWINITSLRCYTMWNKWTNLNSSEKSPGVQFSSFISWRKSSEYFDFWLMKWSQNRSFRPRGTDRSVHTGLQGLVEVLESGSEWSAASPKRSSKVNYCPLDQREWVEPRSH